MNMKKIKYLIAFLLLGLIISCGEDENPPMNEDTQSPTAPSNLVVSNISESTVDLNWNESNDNVGVVGYNVYQDGVIVSEGTSTSATILNLSPETTYSFYITAEDAAGNESTGSNVVDVLTADGPLEFLPLLSQMGIFQGELSNLEPAEGVQEYEIHSRLFTDYAKKPRHIKLPTGASMEYDGTDLLPSFPDNTIISKTFYYNIDDRDPSLGKQIIETRLFLKLDGVWQATDYLWNAEQTDATRDDSGGQLPISYIDIDGNTQDVLYQIPSSNQCAECHNNNGQTFPIGMKLRNLNFVPSYTNMNQLQYFINNGILSGIQNPTDISVQPDWQDDITYTLDERARAYMDINCAHCHSPGGSVPPLFMIDFRLETPFAETGIYENRGEIEARFESTTPLYRMPLLGRTVVHDEALTMLVDYLDTL